MSIFVLNFQHFLQAIETGSSDKLMPGLIFNLKKKVVYKDPLLVGDEKAERKVQAGRMESTMQNMADYMVKRWGGITNFLLDDFATSNFNS